MRKVGLVAAALLGIFALGAPAGAHERGRHRPRLLTAGFEGDGGAFDCRRLRVEFDGSEPARGQEDLTIPGKGTLHVRAADNSGVRVLGAERADYAVKLCKAAPDARTLGEIRAVLSGRELSVSGPERDGEWVGYLLIEAPRGAQMDLEALNGSIGVADFSGQLTARSTNGPLSLKKCGSEVRARVENGPIRISGSGGQFDVEAQNGPISVALDGTTWEGKLEARAINGPLTVRIPEGFRSGMRVEGSDHSPMRCRDEACRNARRSWDDHGKFIEFGNASPVVLLSTVNGPVSVRSWAPR
jgi:hypothetical protein